MNIYVSGTGTGTVTWTGTGLAAPSVVSPPQTVPLAVVIDARDRFAQRREDARG